MLSTDSGDTPSNDAGSGGEFTVAVAEVVSSIDAMACGRVQVQVPWLQATRPWARVALPGAGSGRGTYAIPHPGDEVLVAFNRNDVTDCYVIGGLWNPSDPPPRRGPLDPVTRLAMTSQVGHELDMDDIAQTITITTSTGMKVELGPEAVTLSTTQGTAMVELTVAGDLKLSALKSISLSAPDITIDGTVGTTVKGASVSVEGSATCSVRAPKISLN